jgi:two-component system osmolarity sensor histidine kinase EnvZ
VERIARMHGGALDLRPREGGGLVARVTFPLAA